MLYPIKARSPRHYGPWERVVCLLTEALVAAGAEVTLFATAKTSPTIAIRLLTIATGQKLGNGEDHDGPDRQHKASARTITPRLAQRLIDRGTGIGAAYQAIPSRLLTVVTRPTSDWLQCCRATRKTLR